MLPIFFFSNGRKTNTMHRVTPEVMLNAGVENAADSSVT